MTALGIDELQGGLAHILGSPRDEGSLEMVVRRPTEDEREVVAEARIERGRGVVGDRWVSEPKPSPEAEVTLMNARCVALLAGDVDRWPLAGDQLYVDLDLGVENLPPGSRVHVGDVLLEVEGARIAGLADLFRRIWRLGVAGVEVPLTVAREGKGMHLAVHSIDRSDLLWKPHLH